MEINQIITLIQTVSDSNLTGFSLEEGNMKLTLEKWQGDMRKELVNDGEKTVLSEPDARGMQTVVRTAETAEVQPVPAAEAVKETLLKGEALKSPLVGTFYSASSPEAEPFVKPGDTVKKGQVLGIIEAMKLMNEIEAEKDGIVEAVLVENEQMVEYGQPLFSII